MTRHCRLGSEGSTVGERIRSARKMVGISQTKLAALMGVSVDRMRRWERDQVTPRSSQLLNIANLCVVPVEYFLRPGPRPKLEECI